MKLFLHQDADSFLAAAGSFWESRESENNLILGLASEIRRGRYPDYLLITIGDPICGAALCTPPHKLILTRMDPQAREALSAHSLPVPGVVGPTETATDFAARKGGYRVKMSQWIYECEHVRPPTWSPGRMCSVSDESLVYRWRREFSKETGIEENEERARARSREMLEDRRVWVWEDGEPVAIAAAVAPTPHGVRVGMVYTPPRLRRRGYASSLVAALTQRELDSGRRFCFLYTDATNATSNGIYQKLGYRKVCESCELEFV